MPTLQWLTRDKDVRAAHQVPYRLLEEAPELGYGDRDAGNMLIQGDNLEALKALLPYYAGQVKCIYIDPPYNTGAAFKHYNDNLEHSMWLAMMWPRLELLQELLAEDGSIWVSIDDQEGHYLKVIMDEVFGRRNFVANLIWEKKFSPQNDALYLSDNHDHIHCYAKEKKSWIPLKLPLSDKQRANYENDDNDERGPWTSSDYTCAKTVEERPNLYYPITNPNTGEEIWPSKTRVWGYDRNATRRNIEENMIWWGKKGTSRKPRIKKFLDILDVSVVPKTILAYSEVGTNQDSRREVRALNLPSDFATPKPERLIERVLQIATNPGNLVLDSFLGSGTTAAVAHKMGRRYIGIELGDHAVTHCVPRLQKVIDGEQGGISKVQNWRGGGGFRFYRLGPPVFMENGTIQPSVHFPVLAAHLWFAETDTPWTQPATLTPFLGVHDGRGYALLYNGILGEKSANGGNVLTRKSLATIRAAQEEFVGPLTVYGERATLREAALKAEAVAFKQTPYDVKTRQ